MFGKKSDVELFSQLNEGVIELDRHLKVVYMNAKASYQFRVTGENPPADFFDQHPSFKEALKKCLEDKKPLGELFDGYTVKIVPYQKGLLLLVDGAEPMGKEFIANASHELRTPITIIKGFAEMLQDMPEISGAMLEDITEKIIRNCHRMNQLVKGLLTLADLDNLTERSKSSCDLVSIIDRCGHNLLVVYPESHLETLIPRDEVWIQAEDALIELAVMNLLENGVKYSNGPGDLSIVVEAKKEGVKMVLSDRGMGIPEADLPYIFDRFYTVNKAHSRKLGGAGLGLSIVKSIVQKNGGTISVTSEVGKGTSFTLTFSAAQPE